MKSSMTLLPGSGRFMMLGLIVLACTVFLLGCGGSDAPAPDSGAAEAPGDEADPMPEGEGAEAAGEESTEAGEESGEESEDSAAMEEPAGEAEQKEPDAVAEDPAPAADTESPDPSAVTAEPAEVVNPRPDDVVAWQEEDFRSAKQDRDPKLLDAVAYLGENYSGDADAAKLLVELLTIPEDPEPEPKPEPKVEKKPKKKPSGSGEYDEYMGGEEEYMGGEEEYMGGEEEYMGGEEEYMGGEEDYMGDEYMGEGGPGSMYGGGGGRPKAPTKSPLAASYVSLTGGIVRALGANGTNEARTVLEQLLSGRVPAGNDRAAVGAVLRTLVDYPSTENDALLRKALTTPESYRQSSEKLTAVAKQALGAMAEPQEGEKGPDVEALVAASLANTVTAEDIQDTTLPLVEKSASMRLRYDLAAYLIGTPSEKIGPRLQDLVTATHPLNVQAQIGLYRYAKNRPEMQEMVASFERYFTSYASSSLGRMLAVSTDEGADFDEPIPTGREGAAQSSEEGWSGFGDKTTPSKPRAGGSEGYPSDEGYPGEMSEEPSEMEYDPGPSRDSSEMDEMSSSDYMGEEGYMGGEGGGMEGGGPGGSGSKPLKGPGEADKLSIQKFEEVAASDPNLPYELARQLWGNDLGSAMVAKMNTLPGLADGAQLLMLAGHIPTDKMRAQLLKTLQAHWQEGPEAFASASVASEIGILDPGFVTIVKSLPRREPPARAKADPTKEQSAQYAWMQAAYSTVLAFCKQFQAAADNEKVATAEVIENLPFRVHSTDTLTHVYAIDWQKRVGSRLTGVPADPMRVYYLRFEETAKYSSVLGTYKRAVPLGTERLVKNGLWIDGGRAGAEGTRISMDVVIDRTDFKADRKATDPEPMVIQVLYVEVNDPNPVKAKAAG